eukprot:scaffold157605_cov14-Tisochrysis_lutea.AAC.1
MFWRDAALLQKVVHFLPYNLNSCTFFFPLQPSSHILKPIGALEADARRVEVMRRDLAVAKARIEDLEKLESEACFLGCKYVTGIWWWPGHALRTGRRWVRMQVV